MGDEIRIIYSQGCDLFKNKTEPLAQDMDRLSEAVTVAQNSDVIILCLGLDETLEGEEGDTGNSYASGDKEDLQLPLCQRRLMEVVAQTGKPVILCMMAGSDIELEFCTETILREFFNSGIQVPVEEMLLRKSCSEKISFRKTACYFL